MSLGISNLIFFVFIFPSLLFAQTSESVPQPAPEQLPGPPPPPDETPETAVVMKRNNFTYDGADGRDPFKIYREIPLYVTNPNPTDKGGNQNPEGPPGINTAMVPGDITIVGILYKKTDPIVLVRVRNVRGLVKLRLNSPVGRNEGRVIEIQKDRMIIEQVKDFDGQKFTEKVTVKIRENKKR